MKAKANSRYVGNIRDITTKIPVGDLRTELLKWWCNEKRPFPWRETRDPYRVLIAEILLHRTKAEQVVSLYGRFLRLFPDIPALARATPEKLTQLFYSGGLHWRWKLIHSMAVTLEDSFKGEIPDNYYDLISLPGVSHYIASAVRCFAFGHPDVILDTNTVRVVGRLYDLPITDSSRRSRLFRAVLEELIDTERPREFNFALIDFAALICKSKTPKHEVCHLNRHCYYYKKINFTDN